MGIPCVPTASGIQYQTEKDDRLIIHEIEIENALKMHTSKYFHRFAAVWVV